MSNEKSEKQVLLDNITYYLEKTGMKIGELEAKCGVSTGYISRLYKEDKAKPSFEFVKSVAKVFHSSIDKMVYIDRSTATPTELYLFDFMQKLEKDTTLEKLSWQEEHLSDLQGIPKDEQWKVNHPLLSYGSFLRRLAEGGDVRYEGIGFISHTYEADTIFEGTSYYLSMPNGVVLYMMPVMRSHNAPKTLECFVVEAWMVSPQGEKKYLCTGSACSPLGVMTYEAYAAVMAYCSKPKLSLPFREAIDAFMGNTPPDTADKEETDGN